MKPLRVLIADGDRDLCVLYHAGLGRYGFEVTSAATGLECVARLKDSAPDVLVLEPALPLGSGEDVLARMRENAEVPCVPVILHCASLLGDRDFHNLCRPPVGGCHLKPLPAGKLAERICCLLGRPMPRHVGACDVVSDGASGRGFGMPLQQIVQKPEPLGRRLDARVPDAAAPAKRRILIVEDNADAAESLAQLLELSGHEARTARDGPRALEAARAFAPDVVLLDIGLPGMDGYDLAPLLRQIPGAANALVVALTGNGEEHARRRALEAGFDAHVLKPADLDTLLRLLGAPARPPDSRPQTVAPPTVPPAVRQAGPPPAHP